MRAEYASLLFPERATYMHVPYIGVHLIQAALTYRRIAHTMRNTSYMGANLIGMHLRYGRT
jgi:hypothetical protein